MKKKLTLVWLEWHKENAINVFRKIIKNSIDNSYPLCASTESKLVPQNFLECLIAKRK